MKALAVYRMECAREALSAAGVLFQTGHLTAYVNRLYYACFYADFVVFQADEVRPWLEETTAFVDFVDDLIARIGPPTTGE